MPERQHLLFLHLTSQQLKTKRSETLFLWILSFYFTYPTSSHPTHTQSPEKVQERETILWFASLKLEFPGLSR